MAHVVTAESAYGKELAKWEGMSTRGISGDWAPGNPYRKGNPNKPVDSGPMKGHGASGSEYPKMLYMAQKRNDGSWGCMDGMPHPATFLTQEQHDRACMVVEHFNKQCVVEVQDEADEQRHKEMGWRETVPEAYARAEQKDIDLLKTAANRAYGERNMSDKAKAEIAAAEAASGIKQLGEIPEQRRARKRPGPKPKQTAEPQPA